MFINWTLMLLMFSMFFLVCLLFLLYNNSFIIIEYSLVTILSHEFKFYILLDWMSCMFSFIVLLISSMVLWYSFSYMMLDKNKMSFCWMVLFLFYQYYFLILMPNMCMLILGWDGLGLVSYCLVIYYQSVNSYNSGMMTIISNRVGDVMIIMMIIFAINFNSFELVSFRKFELIWGLLIIIAAMTKSAQIPFSAWLPAAMAAPTPVSALVHSSTLVTAGVYLLIRFNLLFNYSIFSSFLLKISLMTMVMAGINAFFENDLKKIIAFSTLSQLSIMMLTLALGLTSLSFFHLIVHAIFKSMLFLCAGFIIHNLMGNQDIRFLSNFFKFSPTILSCMIIGMLSLMGFPFIGGFYSKDIIMEFFFKSQNMIEMILFIIGILFTFLYNMRLSYMILLKGTTNVSLLMNNLNVFMKYPILILSMKLIMMSNLMSWMIISNYSITFLSNQQKLMMMMMIFICIYVYNKSLSITYKFLMNMKFFMKMWYLNNLTSYILLSNNKRLLQMSINDWSWMEMMGPLGMKKMIMNNFNFSLFSSLNKFEIIFGMIFLMMFLFVM
uniref:NADH-ubiquinone oxidoreductase chain 5 n=1 Tax=Rhipicephalus microplus TaxID=6941 RepID=A0A068CA46_RHIMP|nr:NADH dehydrogenase subunit 5 [Rhipicephalus microplus]